MRWYGCVSVVFEGQPGSNKICFAAKEGCARKLRICKKLNITGTTPLRVPGEGLRRRLNRKLRHHRMRGEVVRRWR